MDDLPTKVIVEEQINEDLMKLVPQVCQRPTREWKLWKMLEDFVVVRKFANLAKSLEHPKDFAKAWARDQWCKKLEANRGRRNECFEKKQHMGVIKVAKDCKAIGCKWVFRTKRNAQGWIVHHKTYLWLKFN